MKEQRKETLILISFAVVSFIVLIIGLYQNNQKNVIDTYTCQKHQQELCILSKQLDRSEGKLAADIIMAIDTKKKQMQSISCTPVECQ